MPLVVEKSRLIPVVLAMVLAAAGCAKSPATPGKPVRRAPKRVFIIGFDGMDPTLARQFMDEGKLPNLKQAGRAGNFTTARIRPSPRSPRRPGRASPPA